MKTTWKEAQVTNGEQLKKNKGKLEENTHNLWKTIAGKTTWEKGTCHMQH